ncbi:MAG: HEAT repeat domain-containing protein [Planctomycetes bacterium]|nr:HEAT repeat domain-containing protein [Planctomycetota bacterium]
MNSTKNLIVAATAAVLIAATALCLPSDAAPAAPAQPAPIELIADAGKDHGATPVRESVAMAPDWYGAAPGTRLHYDLGLDMSVSVKGKDETRPFASHATATMLVTVLDRRGHELLVDCALPDLRLAVRGDEQGATAGWQQGMRTAMAQRFLIRMDRTGKALGMRFHESLSSDQRNWARALWTTFSFRLDDGSSWQVDGRDAMGSHGFTYRRLDDGDGELRIERRRSRFVPHGARTAALADVELGGEATARFAAAAGWLTDATVAEQLAWTMTDCAGMRFASQVRGAITLRTMSRVAVPADWSGPWAEVSGEDETSTTASAQIEADWDRRIAGRDLATLVRQMDALLANGKGDGNDYFELLWCVQKLLERDPALAARIAAMVQRGDVGDRLAAGLLSALGMAGHASAQHALGDVFGDFRMSDELRTAAVESMFQVAHPTAELVGRVQQSLQDCARMTDLDGSAMLALGAFAAAGAHGCGGGSVAATLMQHEGLARQSGASTLWSEALGNCGDGAVLPLAQRLLQSPDAAERQRGLTMVRRVDLPAAHEILGNAATTDADADVRRYAVELIGESLESWATAMLADRAAADVDVEVRRAAITALGTRAETDAAARGALEMLAGRESDPTLIALLRQLRDPA